MEDDRTIPTKSETDDTYLFEQYLLESHPCLDESEINIINYNRGYESEKEIEKETPFCRGEEGPHRNLDEGT